MVELKHFGSNTITGFLIIILSLSVVLAEPGVPHQFYGDVIINGYSAPNNLKITVQEANGGVYDNESTINADFTKDGTYDLYALNNNGGLSDDDLLEFYIKGIFAANHIFRGGASTRLNLSVTIPGYHFCGDGTCDSDEGCSSCPSDCGCASGYECKSDSCVKINTDGGSPSGGGGSSSSSSTPPSENNLNETSNETSGSDTTGNETFDENETIICEENWKCSEWFECFNSKQKRVCTDLNDCGTETNKPSETQACLETSTENQTSDKNNSFFTTTGRFLTSPTGLVSIFGLLLVAIIGFLVYQKKIAGEK